MSGDPDQTRLAMAALAASIVLALDERSPGVRQAVEGHMEKAYLFLRDAPKPHPGAMETLRWTKEFLKELS